MNKDCIVNPRTNRAVKTSTPLGKRLLEEAKRTGAGAVLKAAAKRKLSESKTKQKPPEPFTMYKEPIGPKKPQGQPKQSQGQPKKPDDIDLIVDEFDTDTLPILMFQLSQKNNSIKNMISKIESLTKKNKAVIPSDLFSFYPKLLDKLISKYGASTNTINMIDDGIRSFISYIDEEAIFPDEIDYKYYTKFMNGQNKNKFSFLVKTKQKPPEPFTMYKEPIGPKKPKKKLGPRVENIPMILKTKPDGSNKVREYDRGYKNYKIKDDPYWREVTLTKDDMKTYDDKSLINHFDMWLSKIAAYFNLNKKLDDYDKYDFANFYSIYKYIDKLIIEIERRMKLSSRPYEYMTGFQPRAFESKEYKKYLKLRKKIIG